jgi:hypothetical protein
VDISWNYGEMRLSRLPVVLFCAFLPGCQSAEYWALDGSVSEAGDAVAANTVMQIVDPWPRGVDRTQLLVPAVRNQHERRNDSQGPPDW